MEESEIMLEMNALNTNLSPPKKAAKEITERVELIRAVRRGIKITEKYLNDQKDISQLDITKTDIEGRNIFHLGVQSTELLEFLLEKFGKHPQLKEALYTEDVNGNTPAHLTSFHSDKKGIHILGAFDKNLFKYKSKLTGKSVIHCAVESGNKYMVESILDERPDAMFDEDANSRPPQHYAAALKESIILEYFLAQGANIMETDENGYTALHVAADIGSISNVKFLVFDEKELVDVVDKDDQTALHLASKNGHVGIVSFLLENEADPLQRNTWGCTVLECAIHNKQQKVVDELLRSDNWKNLASECKGGLKRCFTTLLTKMPRSAEILMDRCIKSSDHDPDEYDFCLTYDFSFLQPSASGPRKFEVLSAIVESDRESFLLHNVCQKYLSFMWREKGFKVYTLNLSIYLIFHILFNVYVALVRGAIARVNLNETSSATTAAPYPESYAKPHETGPIITTVIIVSITSLNIIRELVQLYSSGWKYFKQVSNYFEWIMYVSVMVCMFPVREKKTFMQFGFASFAVFFSWFNLIWFLRRLPDIGTYILTLKEVFKTLMKMLLIIILFCMAFASTFYLVLAEQPRFRNFGIAVLSSFISMLGDFAYDDLFVDIGIYPTFYSFKIVSFILFILLMGIVVNNVLIGLAVGDTDRVINRAELQRLREQAEFVIEIENSVMNKIPWPWGKRHMETVITEYPNHPITYFEKFIFFIFGESKFLNKEEEDSEDEDGDGIPDESVEEIINARLENYHKQMMAELKQFHVELLEEIKNTVGRQVPAPDE